MAYQIEKNVPLKTYGGYEGITKYPCRQMEEGDSFLVPFDADGPQATFKRVSCSIQRFQTILHRRFPMRTTPEGVRVWCGEKIKCPVKAVRA